MHYTEEEIVNLIMANLYPMQISKRALTSYIINVIKEENYVMPFTEKHFHPNVYDPLGAWFVVIIWPIWRNKKLKCLEIEQISQGWRQHLKSSVILDQNILEII